MRILITGGNGFIAKHLAKGLAEYEVISITRQDFDLRDRKATNLFFCGKHFDLVIHTAMVGGRRTESNESEVLQDNLIMFYNLMANQDRFSRLINFGSGAELDRAKDITVNKTRVRRAYPLDAYGMAKNIIGRICEQEGYFNLRIFNVFGEDEAQGRLITNSILSCINNTAITIHQNKLMDFFYIQDLISIIKYYIKTENPPKQLDCVYTRKTSLYDIAKEVCEVLDKEVPIHVEVEDLASSYIGDGTQLANLGIGLIGLKLGIKNVYRTLI